MPLRLNVSTKGFALIGATLLLLDFASTSVVSAATAAAYLEGEVPNLPFPPWVGALIVLVLFTIVSLMGVRESARIALTILSLHVNQSPWLCWTYLISPICTQCITMSVLIIIGSIKWGQIGIGQLRENWVLHQSRTGTSSASIARQVYYGFCLGMLGMTGFECRLHRMQGILAFTKPPRYPIVYLAYQRRPIPARLAEPPPPGYRTQCHCHDPRSRHRATRYYIGGCQCLEHSCRACT